MFLLHLISFTNTTPTTPSSELLIEAAFPRGNEQIANHGLRIDEENVGRLNLHSNSWRWNGWNLTIPVFQGPHRLFPKACGFETCLGSVLNLTSVTLYTDLMIVSPFQQCFIQQDEMTCLQARGNSYQLWGWGSRQPACTTCAIWIDKYSTKLMPKISQGHRNRQEWASWKDRLFQVLIITEWVSENWRPPSIHPLLDHSTNHAPVRSLSMFLTLFHKSQMVQTKNVSEKYQQKRSFRKSREWDSYPIAFSCCGPTLDQRTEKLWEEKQKQPNSASLPVEFSLHKNGIPLLPPNPQRIPKLHLE